MGTKLFIGEKVQVTAHSEEAIWDFYPHKNESKLLLRRFHTSHGSNEQTQPLSSIIRSFRQLKGIEDELKHEQTRAITTASNTKQLQDKLRYRQQKLPQSLRQFNQFVKKNENKSKRSKSKILNTALSCKRLEQEIQKLQGERVELAKVEKDLQGKIADFQGYRRFLQSTVDEKPHLLHTNDIFLRHMSVELVKSMKGADKEQTAMQMQAERITNLAAYQRHSISELNTQLEHLRRRKELSQVNLNLWTATSTRFQTSTADHFLALEQVDKACQQMLKYCQPSGKLVAQQLYDPTEKLGYITQQILKLESVASIIRRKCNADTHFSIVPPSTTFS